MFHLAHLPYLPQSYVVSAFRRSLVRILDVLEEIKRAVVGLHADS